MDDPLEAIGMKRNGQLIELSEAYQKRVFVCVDDLAVFVLDEAPGTAPRNEGVSKLIQAVCDHAHLCRIPKTSQMQPTTAPGAIS